MNNLSLDTYLRDLKFVVIADEQTGKPFEIFFGFHLPNLHLAIYNEAIRVHSVSGMHLSVQGGGRITKRDNIIVFHGRSEKYGKYEDEIVLALAPKHPLFAKKEFSLSVKIRLR
ncbi:MAG: hypothetical protein ABIJ97_01075 [Bacteroidota bacterium]